jgi:hypothetical protein
MGKHKCYAINKVGQKSGQLYTWCPIDDGKRAAKASGSNKKYYCTALPRSQGEDWIVTYVYTIIVVDGIQQKIAYVECDYVK